MTDQAIAEELKKLSETSAEVVGSHKQAIEALAERIEFLEASSDLVPLNGKGKRDSLKNYPELLRYIKSGDLSQFGGTQKDLSIGGTDAGQVTVPEFLVRRIHDRMSDLSPLVSQVLMPEPASSSDIRVPVNLRGTGTEWVAETGTRNTQNTPTLKSMVPTHGGCSSLVRLTQWLLQDSPFMLEDFLINQIATEQALALESAVIGGNGTNKPTGMTNSAPVTTTDAASPERDYQTLQYIASGASASIPHDPNASPLQYGGDVLHDVVAALRIPYRQNARWLMNRTTLNTIAKWKDSYGRYLISPGLQGESEMLLGYPVMLSDQVADIGTNAFPIFFGDFDAGYKLFQINQPLFVRDPFSTIGYVRLWYEVRYAGALQDSDAIKVLKVASS